MRDILRVMWPASLEDDVEQLFRIFSAAKHLENAVKEIPKIISSQARVCMVGGQWEWQVNVMDEYGESKPVSLPAQ